jgi:putative glutamine amidotransferase
MNTYRPNRLRIILIAAGIALIAASCGGNAARNVPNNDREPVRIAVSKAVPQEAYQNYARWIRYGDTTATYYDMYHLDHDSAIALLAQCDGLLLTGGTDIYPGRYGKEEDTVRCWEPDFKRDTLESALLREALRLGMPVMGICRGLQMINVELGGTLYIDLPEDLDTLVVHRLEDSYDARHAVTIKEASLLEDITGVKHGTVNSAHHQGIELLADGLTPMALTDDGLVESIAIKDADHYLLGVQWHPERMDYGSPLSGPLARKFLSEASKFQQTKRP